MTATVSLACDCGNLTGKLDTGGGGRLVCYCQDCQALARYLKPNGELLDANGGSDIFQTAPANLQLTDGLEHLACMRLSPKGLLRWYAKCCNTPVGNTMPSANWAFVGIPVAFLQDSDSADDVLGPVTGRVNGRSAYGDVPADTHASAPPSLILKTMGKLLGRRVTGKHRPTPFFDASGKPVSDATVLSLDERDALRRTT